jgi:hypothetical protein
MNIINVKEKIDKLTQEIVNLEDDVKLLEKKANNEKEEKRLIILFITALKT